MESKRILIIDNDVAELARARRILESDGYEVFSHTRTFDATVIARQLRPDLILLDVDRGGLAGEKLHAVLRASDETRDIPVVFWSAGGEDSLRASARRFGARGYVVKGSRALLRHCVARVVGAENPDRKFETSPPTVADDVPS
ncbi:MAG TPA: response regulator [Thermoanaerobaculia bacterium]|nr:response regulator [Thermoanaerobaculia bacterium]